ncbi:MAG: hypothetical protein HZB84_02705 [Deltaproteobacteria bacterium]|nr:hypothetical protein [Deltaproteobacteria bacterium]
MNTALKSYNPIIKPDILAALQREGVILRQKGRAFWASCPLHSEKTPSFKVDPERQTFYCFGCRRHGDVIAFVMERHGLTFREALTYLGIENSRIDYVQVRKNKERRALIGSFRAWEKERRDELATLLRACRQVIASRKPPLSETELEALALLQGEIDYLEYLYDILCNRDDRDKYELFKEELGYGE